jgi:hypothetical protein
MSTIKVTRFEWSLDYEELSVSCHCSEDIRESDPFEFKGIKYQLKLRPSQPYSEEANNEDVSSCFTLYFCVNDYGKHEEAKVTARIWLEDDEDRMLNFASSKTLNQRLLFGRILSFLAELE